MALNLSDLKEVRENLPNDNQTASLMERVAQICISGGAISLGGDLASNVIEACVVYKGRTYTGHITREALYKSKQAVITSCNEILERIINSNDPLSEPAFDEKGWSKELGMYGAHFDGEKFIPIPPESYSSAHE